MLLKIVQTSHAADKITVCYGFLSLDSVICFMPYKAFFQVLFNVARVRYLIL